MSVSRRQRFTKANPCPICGGHESLPQGKGVRCWGFLSDDGRYAHCTREESAGRLEPYKGLGTYLHLLAGDCDCGTSHSNPPDRVFGDRGLPDHVYLIQELDGTVVAQHWRWDARGDDPKHLAWRDANGNLDSDGRALNGRPLSSLPLYGAHRLAERLPKVKLPMVVFVEGEKACEALWRYGVIAVAPVTGSSVTPDPEVFQPLRDLNVCVWPDNADNGRQFMARCIERLESIRTISTDTYVIEWTEAPPKGDAYDFLKGKTLAEGRLALTDLLFTSKPSRESSLAPFLKLKDKQPIVVATNTNEFGKHFDLGIEDFIAAALVDIEWVSEPWLAVGTITELDGAVKAAGKTTFTMALVRAVIRGDPFLGRPTLRSPVVYLTEQSNSSFKVALKRSGLQPGEHLRIIPRKNTTGMTWPDIAHQAIKLCKQIGAKLLVVDTLGEFSGLKSDTENDAGAAREAMRPIQAAAFEGIAVWINRHDRKGGGAVGESGRGSSQYAGSVDIVLHIRRPEGNVGRNLRVIESLSRFDQTPDSLVVELVREDGQPDNYLSHGSASDVAAQETELEILDKLSAGGELTANELFDGGPTGTQSRALKDLIRRERISKLGEGRKGSPYHYQIIVATPASEFGKNNPAPGGS